MRCNTFVGVVACLVFGTFAGRVFAEGAGLTTTWSKAEDLAGFEVSQGKLLWVAEGGNPGGFVKAVKATTFLPKPYIRCELRRAFGTEQGTISFDLKAIGPGAVSGARLFLSTGTRAVTYDFAARSIVKHDQTAADGWVRYTVPWKADWTDAQAKAQGWRGYSGEGVDHWTEVLSSPNCSSLDVSLVDNKEAAETAIGLDNFHMDGGGPLTAAGRKLLEPPPPQKKPVVSYAFDEGSGEVLHEGGGWGSPGRISGAKWVRNGGRWALEFDGVDDRVNCGNIDVAGPQTMVAWVWAEPLYSVWLSVPVMTGMSQASRNVLHAGNASGSLPNHKWTHIAQVWDGNSQILYVDGVLVNRVASHEPVWSGDFLMAGPRAPEPTDPPEYNRRFKGRIASLEFYNHALSRQEILEDLRSSNITDSPISISIPQPGDGQIKVELDAARLGRPLKDVIVAIDIIKSGELGGTPLVSATASQFDEAGRAVVDVRAPDLPRGDYVVRTTAKDASGKPLGFAGEEPLSWAGAAHFPSGPEGARRLNNLVTELLRVDGPDTSGQARTFVNPRTGFIYISNGGSAKVSIKPEAGGEQLDLTLVKEYGDVPETFRYLPRGTYSISTADAKDLAVRAVAETVYDYANATPYVSRYGPYGGAFEQHYVYPHANTYVVQEEDIDKDFAAKLRAGGRRLLAQARTGAEPKQGQLPGDANYEYFAGGMGFSHPSYDGYVVDEFSCSDESHRYVVEALERLFQQPRYRGKAFNAFTYAYDDLVTYKGGEPGRQLVRALMKYDCAVQWECYLDSQRTELAAWHQINDKLLGEMQAVEKVMPGAVRSLIVYPYSDVNGGPPWLDMTMPTYNTNTYLEMQVRTVATHPDFQGVRGLGLYRSPYLDEEMVRWFNRLFRHYAIEGHTEPLGRDPFLLTHIRNNEFEEGGEGWTVQAAEEGSVRFGIENNLGSWESRYTGRNGDTVLITRRSAKAPNIVSQQITGLEPGRFYSFRMFSADHRDRTSPHPLAGNVQFRDAELVPDKSFVHMALAKGKQNEWLDWHAAVFRANGTTATLRISDWAGDADPGGPNGQEIMYNFVKIQPYWPPD